MTVANFARPATSSESVPTLMRKAAPGYSRTDITMAWTTSANDCLPVVGLKKCSWDNIISFLHKIKSPNAQAHRRKLVSLQKKNFARHMKDDFRRTLTNREWQPRLPARQAHCAKS